MTKTSVTHQEEFPRIVFGKAPIKKTASGSPE
jgi:hypothetical protein